MKSTEVDPKKRLVRPRARRAPPPVRNYCTMLHRLVARHRSANIPASHPQFHPMYLVAGSLLSSMWSQTACLHGTFGSAADARQRLGQARSSRCWEDLERFTITDGEMTEATTPRGSYLYFWDISGMRRGSN